MKYDFGAFKSKKIGVNKKLQKYQIVGVDEADISKWKISIHSNC
jgi:transcription elongation factor GreB